MPIKYSGADWVESCLKVTPSKLGAAVADVLGQIFRGIYHLESSCLKKVNWEDTYSINVVLPKHTNLCTFDFNELTQLVVLCHDRMLRCEISGQTIGHLALRFHQRKRTGSYTERHPTMEDHIAGIRSVHGEPLDCHVPTPPPEKLYYIIDRSRSSGSNELVFWRPNGAGYTWSLNCAGKYTESEARRKVAGTHDNHIAVACENVESLSHRAVPNELGNFERLNSARLIQLHPELEELLVNDSLGG